MTQTVYKIELDSKELTLDRVVIYNERAQVKRLVKCELRAGTNEIVIQNVSRYYVDDSFRCEGRGTGTIVDISINKYGDLGEGQKGPEEDQHKMKLAAMEKEYNQLSARVDMWEKRIYTLDKLVEKTASEILSEDGCFDTNSLDDSDTVFDHYVDKGAKLRDEKQKLESERDDMYIALNNEPRRKYDLDDRNQIVATLESESGGWFELDVFYQLSNVSWTRKYDVKVNTSEEDLKMRLIYYGIINQNTEEDWREAKVILSSAEHCLGNELPKLGTLEASLNLPRKPKINPSCFNPVNNICGSEHHSCIHENDTESFYGYGAFRDPPGYGDFWTKPKVSEKALTGEFEIKGATTILTGSGRQKVTIGIVDIEPQLIHECVPSVNQSVFLAALAVNNSPLVLLDGEAFVYLNNSFVAKTHLKNVSPSERFSCSLGVDTAIRVEYKPAKKNHEQTGIINKSSTIVTEQLINVKNTRKEAVLVIVKHHVPRSTDEKIKIRLIHPTVQPTPEPELHLTEAAAVPKEGAVLNAQNNLEWTVSVPGSQEKHLQLKWALDHPKEEKVEFHEKF